MPEVVYYISFLSLAILPIVIVLLCAAILTLLFIENGEDSVIGPMIAFTIFIQAAIFCSYIFSYRKLLLADLEHWQK